MDPYSGFVTHISPLTDVKDDVKVLLDGTDCYWLISYTVTSGLLLCVDLLLSFDRLGSH